jgi:outer membrane protein assembly factor BamB
MSQLMKQFSISFLVLAAASCTSEPITKSWVFVSKAPSVSTPLVTQDRIFFGSDVGLDAINRLGGFVWRLDRQGMNVVGGPAAYEDIVLFGSTNSQFYAASYDGRMVWEYTAGARIKSDALTDGDSVIFSSYDGHVYKMAVEDKKMQWIFPSEAAEELPGPPTHPKVKAYIAAMADYSKKVAECAAQAEAAQAEGKAPEQPCEPGDEPAAPSSEQGAEWEWPPADFAYSSPMRVGNLIILGNMDWNVYALNADTGELVWRTRLNGTVTSSAVAGDGVIYIGSNGRLGGKSPEDGRLYALDAKTGKILNNFQAKNEVNSSVRVNGDSLYFGDVAGNMYCLDAKTLKEKWSFKTNGPIRGRHAIYKNLVFIGSGAGDNQMYALRQDDGKVFWKYKTGGKIESDPVISGDELFFTSHDRRLYAFKIRKTP